MIAIITISGWFVVENFRASDRVALIVENFELDSIREHSVKLGPMFVCASKYIAIFESSINILSRRYSCNYTNSIVNTFFYISDG